MVLAGCYSAGMDLLTTLLWIMRNAVFYAALVVFTLSLLRLSRTAWRGTPRWLRAVLTWSEAHPLAMLTLSAGALAAHLYAADNRDEWWWWGGAWIYAVGAFYAGAASYRRLQDAQRRRGQ